MSDQKKIVINCDICDARKVKKENWDTYEQIKINTDLLLMDESSKSVLNQLPVSINADQALELDNSEKINPITQNGSYELNGNDIFPPNTILCVNGRITISPDVKDPFKNTLKTLINGVISCPESVSKSLQNVHLNGPMLCYPDGCTLLSPSFTIDRFFPVRALKDAKYYAEHRILMTDISIDIGRLIEKNVHFITRNLIIAEELLESAIPLFDERAEIKVIPAGYSFADGDATLNETFLIKHGKKIYVSGNFILQEDSLPFLSGVEELYVDQNVRLYENQLEAFRKIKAVYRDIIFIKKRKTAFFANKDTATIDTAILEASPDGIFCENCRNIFIKKDVAAGQILEKINFSNCERIFCSPQQRSAVEAVSVNGGPVIDGSEDIELPVDDSRIINSDYYIL